LANSDLFGKVIKHALECLGVRVEIYHWDEPELARKTSQANLLISALGASRLINKDFVKQDAVLIDIGISRLPDGTVTGDIDAESVKASAGYLTPVPGGVGPMTIAMALKNTLRLYKERK
jgi:methylenetetrahydrofolate dehydrogenase (NADP+)/methenyltetrahydrofolate cyclohydrolase